MIDTAIGANVRCSDPTRLLRGREKFMQKNLPKYTPPWVPKAPLWAESSKREVTYGLCNDRRTLLWFANQRAVEYHPTLFQIGEWDRPTHLVLDIDPPDADAFALAVAATQLARQALAEAGLEGSVKTSGAKGLHVFVPIRSANAGSVVNSGDSASTSKVNATAQVFPCGHATGAAGVRAVIVEPFFQRRTGVPR